MVLIPLAVLAALLLLYCTRWGVGLGGDSFYYVSGARNLLAGLGFSRPTGDGGVRAITHFPPFYSICLAALGSLGGDVIEAARWINAVLFGGLVLVTGVALHRSTKSLWLVWCGQAFILGAAVMLQVYSWALSEPAFLLLALLTLTTLAAYLADQRRWVLYLSAAFGGMACLTRYAGLAVIAAGALALLLGAGRGWRRRATDAAQFVAFSLIGLAIWMAHNALAGAATNRVLGWHPVAFERIRGGLRVMSLWLLPAQVPGAVRAGLLLAVALLVVLGAVIVLRGMSSGREGGTSGQSSTVLVLASFVVAYPAFLVASLSFFDASTPLDDRVLSPLYPVGVILALLAGDRLSQIPQQGRYWRSAWRVLTGCLVVVTLVLGSRAAQGLHADGLGYASRAWRESPIIDAVKDLAPGAIIYSNEIDAIYLLTGRPAFQVPIRWDPVRDTAREDYPQQLELMRDRLAQGEGVLVVFSSLERQQDFLPSEEELAQGLNLMLRTESGAIYEAED